MDPDQYCLETLYFGGFSRGGGSGPPVPSPLGSAHAEYVFMIGNSADPNEMLQSHLGIHCL